MSLTPLSLASRRNRVRAVIASHSLELSRPIRLRRPEPQHLALRCRPQGMVSRCCKPQPGLPRAWTCPHTTEPTTVGRPIPAHLRETLFGSRQLCPAVQESSSQSCLPSILLPLDRRRRFAANVVHHPVDAGHLVDDPRRN